MALDPEDGDADEVHIRMLKLCCVSSEQLLLCVRATVVQPNPLAVINSEIALIGICHRCRLVMHVGILTMLSNAGNDKVRYTPQAGGNPRRWPRLMHRLLYRR